MACGDPGASELVAQTIDGVLLERGSDRPIEMGLVTLLTASGDSVATALTDEDGRFRLSSAEGGEFLLAATALGYEPTVASSVFTIPEDGGMSLMFRIQPIPMEIEGLTLEARASVFSQPKLVQNGFVQRAQSGFGRFITPRDIEASPAFSTADLLTRTGRVTTRYALGGEEVRMLGTRGYCSPTVYVDGVRVSLSGASLDAVAPLFSIEAAEVYRSASEAPPRYGGGTQGCGVIVLWTKAR